jgi:hypothetical protein
MELKLHKELVHDGGRLLRWMMQKLSIDREDWVHTYAFQGSWSAKIPTNKRRRKMYLAENIHMDRLVDIIRLNSPCSVVGMGRLSCEVLTGGSILSKKVGADWDSGFPIAMRKIGVEKVWITYSPDAALYDPGLVVDISRVLGHAAMESNIKIEINRGLKLFDWSNYL